MGTDNHRELGKNQAREHPPHPGHPRWLQDPGPQRETGHRERLRGQVLSPFKAKSTVPSSRTLAVSQTRPTSKGTRSDFTLWRNCPWWHCCGIRSTSPSALQSSPVKPGCVVTRQEVTTVTNHQPGKK